MGSFHVHKDPAHQKRRHQDLHRELRAGETAADTQGRWGRFPRCVHTEKMTTTKPREVSPRSSADGLTHQKHLALFGCCLFVSRQDGQKHLSSPLDISGEAELQTSDFFHQLTWKPHVRHLCSTKGCCLAFERARVSKLLLKFECCAAI